MDITLAKIGVVCIIAAIVGGTLKALSIEFGALDSTARQIMLAAFGSLLIFVHWLRDQQADEISQPGPAVPLLVLVVGGIVVGVVFGMVLNGSVTTIKMARLGMGEAFNGAITSIVVGHVAELGAVLGAICGGAWSYLRRRTAGAEIAMVMVAGAILGASGRLLNPDTVRVNSTQGMVLAAALGAVLALILVLTLRRLRI
jgi:hypothetical protein